MLFTIWLTGLSGVGKTSLGTRLVEGFREFDFPCELVDGDQIRSESPQKLGFTRRDREINVRRIGTRCSELCSRGKCVIVAAISPFQEGRSECRRLLESGGVMFFEIALTCPLEILVRRDVKGLYKEALAGRLKNFTGISDPYESPANPEMLIDTSVESIQSAAQKIFALVLGSRK